MPKLRSVLLVALLRVAAAAVAAPSAAQAADLTVSAAASLSNAFKDIGALYEAQHPGTHVLFNFAASDALLVQIGKGAPVDVFASADQDVMDRADAQKLLGAATRRNFVGNALVMIVPADSTVAVKSLADLQKPEVRRVAIGNPSSVPAGRYTRGALEAAKLWAAVEPKAIMAQSVRQALDYVARAEVEAGFVYATDAGIMKDKVRVVASVPTQTPITYPVAVIEGSANAAAGAGFIDFLSMPAAQAVFARYGFSKP